MKMRQLEITPTYVTQLDGKILPNAYACDHVAGDDANAIIFGTITGSLAIYKVVSDRLVKWRWYQVDGSIASICLDTSITNYTRVFVATAEGSCLLFQLTDVDDELSPTSEFRIPLNVCDMVVQNGNLVAGTRDGGVFVYRADVNATESFEQLAKFEIAKEIESFQLLSSSLTENNSSPQLLIRCNGGEFFYFLDTLGLQHSSIQQWKSPSLQHDATYLVENVTMGGTSKQFALATMSGKITLFSSSFEKQWEVKLPEALIRLDKLTLASMSDGTKHDDVLVACSWSGKIYVLQNSESIVHFRMILPASSMFCVNPLASQEKSEQILVGISTSGTIFIFRSLQDTLAHAFSYVPLVHRISQSKIATQLDTEEARQAIVEQMREQSLAPWMAKLLPKSSSRLEDIVRVATTMASFSACPHPSS